ncbi:MAG: hypothetical protein CMH56_02970, partial [Myxococcales bacterium]|nr:hypothetical protein [Myxococcales bacterium]
QLEEVFEWPFSWPTPTAEVSIPEDEAFKTTITPDDNLVAQTPFGANNPMRWVKFSILVSDPTKVYFQNSDTYPFHYDFAKEHLTPFLGMSPQEFDSVSLYEEGQEVILGAVIFPYGSNNTLDPDEYGIQLVRQDPYHPEMVQTVFDLVKSVVTVEPTTTAYYFPSYEDSNWEDPDTLCAIERFYGEQNIPLSNVTRWLSGNTCYTDGWTPGVLRYIESEHIEEAYENGDLLPTDILVTDGIPAELPYVAGIISFAPTTPNSHVAILAQVYQIPFIYAHHPDTVADVMARLDQEVVFKALEDGWFSIANPCQVRFYDIADAYDAATEAALYALKDPEPVAYAPMATASAYSVDLEDVNGGFVQPADVNIVGGKAANFGILREALPDNSPAAVAFTFNLWNDFMTQTVEGGATLKATIDNKLAAYTYPPNFENLFADLDEIRDLIKDGSFTADQEAAVMTALSSFEDNKKIRFRSSTNLEDTVNFTGAGLYSSYSGCKADDNDDDTEGPSLCDPSKDKERGVFRAMKKVFASFYNDNAYLERLRRSVNEDEVGMAILAHYSFPDEFELANGVATFTKSHSSYTIDLVSQPGAVSVTNPETAALPEEVEISIYQAGNNTSIYISTDQFAELLPIGANVLDSSDDDTIDEYHILANFLLEASQVFETAMGVTNNYTLDFEYKKVEDWGLVVKQIRQIPGANATENIATFLLDEGKSLCLFQGEYSDVYANHRGKLIWDLITHNIQLTADNLDTSFISSSEIEHYSIGTTRTLTGLPENWLNGSYTYLDRDNLAVHEWDVDHGDHTTTYTLSIEFPLTQPMFYSPMVTLDNLYITLKMEHSEELRTLDWDGFGTTKTETVRLEPCRGDIIPENSLYRERTFDGYGFTDYSIVSRFHHPPFPEGPTAGYTAPMEIWLDTTIAGFTSEPMVLSSYFSQSYRPGHHNFSEGFLFEPRADPNVTSEQLAELEEIDLLRIYWNWGSFYSMDNNSCTDDNNTDCCGNGIIDDDEECDNGENEYGSGCDWDCTVEMVVCEDDGPTTNCCGDGIVQGFEECDDGNEHNGDGCNWECDVLGRLGYETTDGDFIYVHE